MMLHEGDGLRVGSCASEYSSLLDNAPKHQVGCFIHTGAEVL